MTLEQARHHPLVQHHGGLIHNTVSHTAECHRFRIHFFLDEPTTEAADYAAAQLGLALTLGGDPSVSDGVRMFFGASNAIIVCIGRTTAPDIVAAFIVVAATPNTSHTARFSKTSPMTIMTALFNCPRLRYRQTLTKARNGMTRKPYFDLIQQAVTRIRDGAGIWRLGENAPPSREELGEAFEHVYTTIQDLGPNDPIVRAFEACELDLHTPFHWEHLIRAFCEIHFAPKKAPKKTVRTEAFYNDLERDIAQIRQKHGDLSDTKFSELLVASFPRYGHLSQQTVRRTISYLKTERDRKREPNP